MICIGHFYRIYHAHKIYMWLGVVVFIENIALENSPEVRRGPFLRKYRVYKIQMRYREVLFLENIAFIKFRCGTERSFS